MTEPRRLGCFSQAEIDRIGDAVRDAETGTSGEIVTYIVGQCEEYREAPWKGALAGALAAGLLVALLDGWVGSWGGIQPFFWSGALLGSAGLGFLLTDRIEVLRRSAVSRDVRVARAQERAEAAFLEEEVFATRDRTGILIFLALFERRAVVIGDEGIHAAIPADEWADTVETIVAGMRRGDPTQAVVDAVTRAARLLRRRSLAPGVPDPNELDDAPRIRDR